MAKVKEFIIHNFLRRILASHFLILMDIIAKYSKIFIKKIKIDDTKFKKKEKSHHYKLFASNVNIFCKSQQIYKKLTCIRFCDFSVTITSRKSA